MQLACRVALKEWAVICAALGRGLQVFIVRKGGIQDRGGEFQLDHREFWLLPTHFHQSADEIVPQAADLLHETRRWQDPPGRIALAHYAVAQDATYLRNEHQLDRLAGQHVWASQVLQSKFKYRQPGLWVISLRVYAQSEAQQFAETPELAGCRSWVDLPDELSTAGLQPAIDDKAYADKLAALRSALADR